MKNIINKLWLRLVVVRYIHTGLAMGDDFSYGFMGEGYGPDYEKRHRRWERRYNALGFKSIPDDVWQLAGGYGEPYEHLLMVNDGSV